MTVAAGAAKAGPYTGNDVASSFAFSFKVFADADIRVVETVIATEVETDLVLNTNYIVTRNVDQDNNPGGTITYKVGGVTTALPSTEKVTIIGAFDYEQPTDIPNGGAFFAQVIENALDRVTLLLKQLKERVDRAALVPVSSSYSVDDFSDDLITLAAIEADITTVSGIASDVTTVAGIAADVTTVADNVGDINNFVDVYQGGKASDPTTRNDGSALQAGDLYFNTTTDRMRVYSAGAGVWLEGNAGSINVQNFSGTGAQTAFSLATAPQAEENTQVYISGVYQQKDQYSVSGTTLTFSSAPPLGTDNIEVVVMSVLALGYTDAAFVSYTPSGSGAVATDVQAKLRESVSVKDFGAVGDGAADDTAAINAALAAISAGDTLHFPTGTYKFTSAISTTLNRIGIRGDGSFQTILKYAGANTTNDIITIGDGVTTPVNWVIEGIRIASDTTMTGGFALRANKLCRSHLFDVVLDGQDGNQKLYGGVWFDGCDDVQLTQHKIFVQAEGVRVNGGIGAVPKAGLFIHGGKIAGGTIGIHVAGAFGGLYVDQTDIISQTQAGLLLDNSQVAETNRETFLGPTCVIDSVSNGGGAGHGVHINESFASGQTLQLTGSWIASSGSHGVYAQAAPGYKITIVGARIFNHGGDGIRCADNTAVVSVVGCSITDNGGYGVNGVNASNNVFVGPNVFASNISGGFNNTVSPVSELNSQKQRIGHLVVEDQLDVEASYKNIGPYASTYHLDTAAAAETIANGGTLDLSDFSGMVIINNHVTGGVHVYIAGAATVALVSSTGGAVGTLAYEASANGYRFTNNTGISYDYGFAIFRTRASA